MEKKLPDPYKSRTSADQLAGGGLEITNNQKGETIIRKRQIRRNGPNTAALGPEVVQI